MIDTTTIRCTPALAGVVQVPGRGGEELRGRLLVGRGPGGRVDDGLHTHEGLCQSVSGDHVHAVRARDRDDVVARGLEHLDDMAADSPGRSRHGNLPACLHD
jgi:hypothetical protein